MKKIVIFSLISIILLGGCGIAASAPDSMKHNRMTTEYHTSSFQFSNTPTILEVGDAVKIQISGVTSELLEPNRPVLPLFIRTYQIPYGSQNVQVVCTPQNITTISLSKKILSARLAPLSKIGKTSSPAQDGSVYNSTRFYPSDWYKYDIGAGRDSNGNERMFIKIICYPVRYSPANNQIHYTASFDVSLCYDAPETTAPVNETYDMVIIAPQSFASRLQPLIDFKNMKGLKTTFQAVEDILLQYTGADPPEQVKYFIKDAYDTWGIRYVLLIGGLKSHLLAHDKDTISAGWKAWWVPVRYVSIPQDDDEGCLSDLYYGCLYNATGAFDSWDSNQDGVYAAWGAPGVPRDTFDLYPEVSVGRLPVANKREVDRVVQKIIRYESSSPAEKPWYTNFIGIGGKTFDYYEGKPDGEYLCDLAYNNTKQSIPEMNLIPIYSSNKNTSRFVPKASDILKAFSKGAGYIAFQGHGNPLVWDTIWFDGAYPDDWCGGITLYHFLRLSNKEKLPIVVVGGCHNGMYNVSLLQTLRDRTGSQYFCYGAPLPVCFSWGLVLKYPGGAIASTGCTGYGMGYQGNPVSLSAKLESHFFYQIGTGATHLGQAHSGSIQKFLLEEEIHQVEAFVITNWALFGDPSLRLGGYS